jgi:hypothetical protein
MKGRNGMKEEWIRELEEKELGLMVQSIEGAKTRPLPLPFIGRLQR